MKISFHRNFEKKYAKLSLKDKLKAKERLNIFLTEPFYPLLKNHPLKGKYLNYRSLNIDGDLRAVFKLISDNDCLFVDIDSHSNLYL